MTETENVPEWAWERLRQLLTYRVGTDFRGWQGMENLARYIAAHEDPLLDEAQSIGDDHRLNFSAMPGVERAILAALRRGIELAREHSQ